MTLNDSIAIFFIFLLLLFIFILAIVIRYRKRIKENYELKSQYQQALIQSQLEIKEQTLQHIGYELHDNFGQLASTIKINLTTLKIDNREQATEKIEITLDLLRQLIGDIKSLSQSLNGDRISQLGLLKCLETEIIRLNRIGLFSADLKVQGNLPSINADKATILFRMAQEILNNMAKHSQAKHIGLLINATENLLTLVFTDDGIGFDVEEKMNSGGSGLLNLRNRARLINGTITFKSAPAKGTEIIITTPP